MVADGIGGEDGGERASQAAVDFLSRRLCGLMTHANDHEIVSWVLAGLSEANDELLRVLGGDCRFHRAGTTVVLGLRVNNRLAIKGVGDSRAYLVRDGGIRQLTTDETLAQLLFQTGHITQQELRTHPQRHVLLGSLGRRDFFPGEDVLIVEMQPGDRFLFCTDGLTDVLPDETLRHVLTSVADPQRAVDELVDLAHAGDAGDDITCVALYVESTSADRQASAATLLN